MCRVDLKQAHSFTLFVAAGGFAGIGVELCCERILLVRETPFREATFEVGHTEVGCLELFFELLQFCIGRVCLLLRCLQLDVCAVPDLSDTFGDRCCWCLLFCGFATVFRALAPFALLLVVAAAAAGRAAPAAAARGAFAGAGLV